MSLLEHFLLFAMRKKKGMENKLIKKCFQISASGSML